MKRLVFVLLFCFWGSIGSMLASVDNPDPVARPDAIVKVGKARFTVLTDRLIRMEWDESGKWEDRASLAIINRNLPVPSFKVTRQGNRTVIKTSSVTLTYEGEEMFNATNLKVAFPLNGKTIVWHPGLSDKGNLLGTTRTLDGCKGFSRISAKESELEKGIISRDGWAVVDESNRHVLQKDNSIWGEWIACREEGLRADWYIFAYGHDYKAALGDFVKVAGRIPMPPKYTLGYWWSRYWVYTDQELLDLAKEMRDRSIPIDVFIIDMDWHETWKPLDERTGHDEFGQRRGWTGYTWNGDLFPDPVGFLHDLHAMGYKTSLNLHPASGIRPYEECYDRFVKDYLSRTNDYDGPANYIYGKEGYQYVNVKEPKGKEGWRAPVPFRMSQQAWADAYFNSVIHPLQEQGVDFWWLDWQQWRESRYVKGLSNTFWLNYTFFNDMLCQAKKQGLKAPRPLIYHRWGGLGSHRYQLGFSGDTYDEWTTLAFLPYFTSTASNVGYGYWGHDIGGHMQLSKHMTNPEMYTRWLQYGVFTPIFKTHSTHSETLDRRIWSYTDHYDYMKEAIELRYALSPYIYTAARTAYDTGICICRPMYYDYPEADNAYTMKEQFMFGDRILATVLCQPMIDGKTARSMWFPKGNDWYDMALHKMMKGGTTATLHYTIAENPWFVKAGSILPLAKEGIQSLQENTGSLRLLVIPGRGKSSYTLYEDDNTTQSYHKDCAFTEITKESTSRGMSIVVHPRKGAYEGMAENRQLTIQLEGVQHTPKSVKVNGVAIQPSVRKSSHAVMLDLPASSCDKKLQIDIAL